VGTNLIAPLNGYPGRSTASASESTNRRFVMLRLSVVVLEKLLGK